MQNLLFFLNTKKSKKAKTIFAKPWNRRYFVCFESFAFSKKIKLFVVSRTGYKNSIINS